MFKWSRNPRIYKYQLNRKNIIFRFFFSKKMLKLQCIRRFNILVFLTFFSKKSMKFPYLRFVKKFCFSKICEKMMFKIPICRNLNFCFQKMQFLDTTEIINTFFEIDIMHGENEIFLVFFHSFSQWLTSRNFTFSNHFYHSSE